ncbi:MPT63 family protein [Mycolicibacterium sp. 22603]|uniref:MPT63 family protein n=1 Tax=Mycolicibacterium sp. 22603 TaxID=3453950 RepID=UPI003F82B9FE
MKTTSIGAAFAAAAIAAAGAITALTAPAAIADDHNAVTTTHLGSQAQLHDGNIVQGWTVTGLKVSTDVIPAQIHGTLWEATATDEALQGDATPIVSNLNARARNGETYRALWGVATAQGVNPSTLAQGQKTTGKVYFDVTGEAPDSVVYANSAADLIVWVTPPPAASTGTGSGARTYQAPAAAEAEATTSTETPAPGEPGTETTSTPATPAPTTAPAGSQGTPLPAGAPETAPAPAGSQGTPLPADQPGLTPAGVEAAPVAGAPAAAAVPGAPAPAAAPVPGAVPAAAPAPAEGTAPAPAEAGSQGTPLPAGAAPTTTPVMAPPA